MVSKIHPITLKFIGDIISKQARKVKFLGCEFKIYKNVFPIDSPFSYSSRITAKRIYPKETDVVLDMGTGTGVQAVICAKRGAKKVLAVDIDSNSLKCALENVKINKVQGVVEIRKSNLFDRIKKDEKFDLIIAQLPFANASYKNGISHLLFDKNYKLHRKFLKGAKSHLQPNGKVIIPSGSVADEKSLRKLIKKYSYKVLGVGKEKSGGLLWKVYFIAPSSKR